MAFNEDERYVLIRMLPDGTPNGVRPVSDLNQGKQVLASLRESGEAEWHLLDVLEHRTIVVSPRWPLPPKCPMHPAGASQMSSASQHWLRCSGGSFSRNTSQRSQLRLDYARVK